MFCCTILIDINRLLRCPTLLKIAIGQIEVKPGRPDINTKTMLEAIATAKAKSADIIIFPEMSIPGYLLGDLWEQTSFLKDCEYFGQKIIAASEQICIIFGNVAIDWHKKNNDGRVRKYNACFIAHNGALINSPNSLYPYKIKTLQPNYREFDDDRYFYSFKNLACDLDIDINKLIQPVTLKLPKRNFKLGCLICEDGWADDYSINPAQIMHSRFGVDFFINISSSPFTLGKNTKRNKVFAKQAKTFETPIIYVNNVGIQNNGKTIYTFDGSSTVYNSQGEIIGYTPSYNAELKFVDLNISNKHLNSNPVYISQPNDTADIYHALSYGLKQFLDSINMKKIVIGVSGGIDSAVASALYTKVLGPENVLLVNMPSIYNSNTTKNIALSLAQNLKCLYTIMPIQKVVDYTINQINSTSVVNFTSKRHSTFTVNSFAKENIQARDRSARILAGLAACFGGGFTCNANKSELTVGYSTLYGDHAGVISVLGDLWKHQVYDLGKYLNNEVFQNNVIPLSTFTIVPSAELSKNQSIDEGKGDPIKYHYHDYLFKAFIETWTKASPEDLLNWYVEGTLEQNIGCAEGLVAKLFPTTLEFIEDLEKWWNQFSGIAVAKRIQAPPILAVSRRSYGFDHRESQLPVYYSTRYLKLKQQLLEK